MATMMMMDRGAGREESKAEKGGREQKQDPQNREQRTENREHKSNHRWEHPRDPFSWTHKGVPMGCSQCLVLTSSLQAGPM